MTVLNDKSAPSLAFTCSKCGGDQDVRLQPEGSKYQFLCRPCRNPDFPALIEKVEAQHQAQEDAMQKAETLILAENVARGQGILAAAQRLQELRPFFVDDHRLLWTWNHETRSWRLSPDPPTRPVALITVMRAALKLIGDASVRYEGLLGKAIQQVGLSKRPEALGVEWVQLGEELHNLKTGEVRASTPEWFVPGAIPWTPNETEETPTIDRLLREWVGEECAATLQEILAYPLYRDYPLHVIVALFGSGRNGKGRFFGLLRRFLGAENVASTEIDRLLGNRFETFNLYGKLAALVGETDDAVLGKTSLLKSLSGQDPVAFEQKGGAVFTSVNTAKIVLSTNNLPPSTDQSDGWSRRWLIVDFPHEFPEGHDILETVPEAEYRALARKSLRILRELLERGSFTGQGTIEERRMRYVERSEPLRRYIEEEWEPCPVEEFVKYSEFSADYSRWLTERHKRLPGRGQISKQLAVAGYAVERANPRYPDGEWKGTTLYIFGLRRKVRGASGASGLLSYSKKVHIERSENYVPNVPKLPEEPFAAFSTPPERVLERLQEAGGELHIGVLIAEFPEALIQRMRQEGLLKEHRAGWISEGVLK